MKEFRKALGQFATGVALITARDREGLPVGITVSSFNSVSIDPPLILFSVDRRTLSLPALLAAEGYAVNILDQSQESISAQFAKAMQKNWQTVAHTPGHAEAPLIEGALAQFECSPYPIRTDRGCILPETHVLHISIMRIDRLRHSGPEGIGVGDCNP